MLSFPLGKCSLQQLFIYFLLSIVSIHTFQVDNMPCYILVAKFSEWNLWSACSVQGGKGWSTRERIAKMDECYTELSERKECGSSSNRKLI